MMIEKELLIDSGGIDKSYSKNDIIFFEGSEPNYYFQILKGKVRLFNTGQENKEFTQGIFTDNECFGTPPLFIHKPYPSTAIAEKDSIIIE